MRSCRLAVRLIGRGPVVTAACVPTTTRRIGVAPSILPYIGHLPIAAIVVKLGQREVKIPKALARKFHLLSDQESKSIMAAASKAKTDKEAADIMKREVTRIAGERQIHHPISDVVHKALEDHPKLRGKYSLRDKRFESLAKDLQSHRGYQDWHREVDAQTRDWIKGNKKATEADFEKWLRWRYSEPDLKAKFPKNF